MFRLRIIRQAIGSIVLFVGFSASAVGADVERIIISCGASCDQVASEVTALGGTVTRQFEYVDAIAAVISPASRQDVLALSGVARVQKDVMIAMPTPAQEVALEAAAGTGPVVGAELAGVIGGDEPADYLFNNDLIGASTLHANGYFGDGVIVGVIDTGTANQSAFFRGGCPTPGPTVIGGETYIASADPTEPAATSFLNGPHGTWVGTTIAANAGFLFSNASTIAQSVAFHAPGSAFPNYLPGLTLIPMVGVAPCAQIYALKTFPAAGGGAPTSDIVAAMERAITLKQNFDSGMPSVPVSGTGTPEDPFVFDSLNIEIVNMSLGGATLYAGNDIDDLLTEVMLENGITIVNSAGNEGFQAMTGGSAGTGRGTITTAAASTPAHERILRDLQFGFGIGSLYRPFGGIQTATFSSRGPSADGRVSTNVTTNGLAMFAQGANGSLSLVSGTSFSCPTVAGAAALLHGALTDSSAVHVRNAIIDGADWGVLADGSGPFEQGNGFLDVPAALALLQSGFVGEGVEFGTESASVKGNIADVGVQTIDLDSSGFSTTAADLLPGQVAHYFIDIKDDFDQVTVSLSNITPELPPWEQNVFFGDDIFFVAQDARTSDEDILAQAFVNADTTFTLDDPQPGIMRLGVMGDWTNAGRITVDVDLSRVKSPRSAKTAQGKVAQSGFDPESFEVPAGAAELLIELSWTNDWGAYPTDDLDMILITPGGFVSFAGATLDSPERVVIANPEAGTWTALINGFTVWGVHGSPDSHWDLRASVDGVAIK